MSIISQNCTDEVALLDCIQRFFFRYHVGKLLSRCNGTKEKGIASMSLLRYKLGIVFQDRSMYMQQRTGTLKENFSKNRFYRFLNSTKTNRLRFTSLLAADIVNRKLKGLTEENVQVSLLWMTSCSNDPTVRKQNWASGFLTIRI